MTVAPTDGGFRKVTLLIYRIVSVVILVVLAIAGLDALGVFGEGVWQGPFYTLYAVFAFGIVFAWIPGFFYAVFASIKLAHDWKAALPVWSFVAGSVAMIAYQWRGAEEPVLLTATGWLLGASALATAWAGWTQR
jgi:hypothetical protein